MQALWKVIGGVENGGILVRERDDIASELLANRLATGSTVEQSTLSGDRLHYKLVSGSGPPEGWVSTRIKTKELMVRINELPRKDSGLPLLPGVLQGRPGKAKPQSKTSICLKMLSVTGECLELVVVRSLTIADLKKKLAKTYGYPSQCLNFLLGAESMIDAREIRSYCSEQEIELHITVVISLQGLYDSLDESCSPASRVASLQRIAEVAPRNCETSIRVVLTCFESKAPSVRREAVQTLMKLIRTGQEREGAILELEVRFKHKDPSVRLDALHAWQKLIRAGEPIDVDDRIISAMGPLSQDSHQEVRSAAFEIMKNDTFLKAAQKGDDRARSMAQAYVKKYNVVDHAFCNDFLWINPEEAIELHKNAQAVFLDARDSGSVALSHISAALSLPDLSPNRMADYLAGISFHSLTDYPEFSVIVYSDTGSPISRCGLVSLMLRRGPWIETYRVLRLNGGLNLWKHCGFPVEGDMRPMYAGEFREAKVVDAGTLEFDLRAADDLVSGIEELILG